MGLKREIVALFLVLLATVGTSLGVAAYDRESRPPDVITLVAHTPRNGNWSDREIYVKQGDRVQIRLTSEDVTHGFLVPDLNINAGPITPGEFKTIEFTAQQTGTFKFYCNILCSHEHGNMFGKIVVE